MSPRQPRFHLKTYTYFHVTAVGNNGQALFADDEDRRRYLQLLERECAKRGLELVAYCLMTNHIHLLLRAPSIRDLSRAMQALHTAYVVYFNRRHGRTGHLFGARFNSTVIKDEAHFARAKEYIENNPVPVGLAKSKKDYPWSSAKGDGGNLTSHA